MALAQQGIEEGGSAIETMTVRVAVGKAGDPRIRILVIRGVCILYFACVTE